MASSPEPGIPMRPGMRLLLQLLRGHSVYPEPEPEEWEWMLALAEAERILPWMARLCAPYAAGSPHLGERLKAIQRDAAITAFFWSSELKAILRVFEQSGIAVVPLKGPFLGERLYGEAALRVNHDLDLLVAKADLGRAEATLASLGFVGDIPDDYHRPWFRGQFAVELHHNVENPLAFDFQIANVLRRTGPATFQGMPCRQFAPRDELLFLCLHGVRHRFERLSLVLDLSLAFAKLDLAQSLPAPPEIAEASSLLALGAAMARRLRPELGLELSTGASPAQIEHLDGLADRLWQRLLTETCEPLDWSAAHAFYLEIELPQHRPLRHLRHLQILLARVIKPDYEFAASLGCHRIWQARLLRPLRLLRDAMRHLAHSPDRP